MARLQQIVLIASIIIASWLGMQAIHELGHVLAAMATSGRVENVVLHPLTISRTDFVDSQRPLLVIWAGPVGGIVMPLLLWSVYRLLRCVGDFVLRFFAGFCCIANGAYIGVGSFEGIGDCGELLRLGAPTWQLWLFGLVATIGGFFLWNGLGPKFGIGRAAEAIDTRVVVGTVIVAIALLEMGLWVGRLSLRSLADDIAPCYLEDLSIGCHACHNPQRKAKPTGNSKRQCWTCAPMGLTVLWQR